MERCEGMYACRYTIAVLVCTLLAAVSGFGQPAWTVTLNGKVLEDNKPLAQAVLILKSEGVEVQKVVTALNGRFSIVLENDHDYELFFTKQGYVTKYISYNTKNVPEDKVKGLYSEFEFELELFREMEGLNTSILEFPVFKVRYYPGVNNLEYDKKHENKIRSRMNLLLKEYEAGKARELEAASNAVDLEEKRRIDKAYDEAITLAGSYFIAKTYEKSREAYEKALEIKPKESFPRDKIVEIEKLLKDRDNATELSKEMEEQYATLIKTADEAFNNGKYASAKSLYKRAALIAPDRPYPNDQIALAEEHQQSLDEQQAFKSATDEKYDMIIARADNELMGEDYVRARVSYLSALKVKPEVLYPKQKIAEIDSIIAVTRVGMADITPPENVKVKQKIKKSQKNRDTGKETTSKDEEAEADAYLAGLAEQYGEGITEEILVEGDKQTTRVIVVRDGKANEYKKIVYSWATYYKKNNQDIPKYVFENETKK